MNVPPNELLRMLASGVNPVAPPASVRAGDGGSLDFRAMLERAGAGRLETGLPVRTPLGMSPTVGAGEHESLSRAADRAEQAGIERALVDLGNRAFRVNVRDRAVIDAPDAALRAVGGIDGYVRATTPDQVGKLFEQGGAALRPARVVRNQSLIDALARVQPDIG